MNAKLNEIAPDVYRISVYVPDYDLQFNHFLVKDDEPVLYHTGMRMMFSEIRTAVSRVIDPSRLRWIGFSHFESDECGSLNDWLQIAPSAQPVCSVVGALVNMADFASRPARGLNKGEVMETGRYRFRFQPTPHLPHGWDAGALFEETQRTLFCSDLFHHSGQPEPLTDSDVVARSRETLIADQRGPLAGYVPYTANTGRLLNDLAALEPRTLAIMHGSSFAGDGATALRRLDQVYEEVLGRSDSRPASVQAETPREPGRSINPA